MLKRPYEDDLVAVWAESDQVQLSFEIVLVAWVRPKVQERSCRLPPRGPSRDDQSIRRPLQGYKHIQNALFCSIRDAGSRSCRCIQSSTFLLSKHRGAELHADICA